MYHAGGGIISEKFVKRSAITNVGLVKMIARMLGHRDQRFEISRVSKLVDIDDMPLALGN